MESCILAPVSLACTLFDPHKKILFRHGKSYRNEDADFYTLHGEDQLPLCSKRGYIGITLVQFHSGRIVDSCNGIICLRIKNHLSLWNPSIRFLLSVPECPRSSQTPLGRDWSGIWCGIASLNLSLLMCHITRILSVECFIGEFPTLVFPSTSSLDLYAYCDANWDSHIYDRKSTTGYCAFLVDSLISWKGKKQDIVSQSSTEFEH
uniref:Uncharacterized protein n=1 Tax=Lactuca sativa TaxID=4236 RepID=A0A9R1UZY8_LACSA|nr:hypothetical protein LSAT_V11C700383290 [Lactuca sativa]